MSKARDEYLKMRTGLHDESIIGVRIKPCRDYIAELEAEKVELIEMIYAIADAKSMCVMQSSAKLFKEWIIKNEI
jgi:hypothetical protein